QPLTRARLGRCLRCDPAATEKDREYGRRTGTRSGVFYRHASLVSLNHAGRSREVRRTSAEQGDDRKLRVRVNLARYLGRGSHTLRGKLVRFVTAAAATALRPSVRRPQIRNTLARALSRRPHWGGD